jgi:hypothetical protein
MMREEAARGWKGELSIPALGATSLSSTLSTMICSALTVLEEAIRRNKTSGWFPA